jgi:hypothetical protein
VNLDDVINEGPEGTQWVWNFGGICKFVYLNVCINNVLLPHIK